MVDYVSGGGRSTTRTGRACPNDRYLALRAKIRKGWSVRTQQEVCFPRQSVKLDEYEQEVIRSVIKRAEEFEHEEQKRVGCIIERLNNLRRSAVGNGVNQCLHCGTKLFFLGFITTSRLVCNNCKKAVCRECAVDCTQCIPLAPMSSRASKGSQSSSSKGSIWWCKICVETRETLKKSGGWFIKGVPKYILPPKKRPPPEGKYSPLHRVSYMHIDRARALSARPFEEEEESNSDEDRAVKFLKLRSKEGRNQYVSHHEVSTLTTLNWCSESDRVPLSGSSLNRYKRDNEEEQAVGTANNKSVGKCVACSLGSIEFTLIYDSGATAIHVSLHRAKNLTPMDINSLADPFCKLSLEPKSTELHNLRTRTVHKTCNPQFNETLTFYGVTESDKTTKALHILVLDDDKYGYDFMGEVRFFLAHVRPDVSKQFNLHLEMHYPVENQKFWWIEDKSSCAKILITLCFVTERQALLVGIVCCTNLLPMDRNCYSDPFVKLRLIPDAAHKKYKTSVKRKNLNPVFKEEFLFKTTMQELSQQTLVISVWDKNYGKSNDYLGCLELSCKSKGQRLKHWLDMMNFPDHKHTAKHKLCEDHPPPQ